MIGNPDIPIELGMTGQEFSMLLFGRSMEAGNEEVNPLFFGLCYKLGKGLKKGDAFFGVGRHALVMRFTREACQDLYSNIIICHCRHTFYENSI